MNVVAIVLAAGASRRMGTPKQTLPYGGTTMVGAVVRALSASRVERIVAVLGYHADAVAAALAGTGVELVTNPDPAAGMLSSVQCGLRAASGAGNYMIALADQPQIRKATVDALIEAAETTARGIVLPVHDGKRGHPVLFAATYRDEILALPLSVGLNDLARRHADDVLELPVAVPAVLDDLDTPEQYRRAVRRITDDE